MSKYAAIIIMSSLVALFLSWEGSIPSSLHNPSRSISAASFRIASFIAFGIFLRQHASVEDQGFHQLSNVGLGVFLANHARFGITEDFGAVFIFGLADKNLNPVGIGTIVGLDRFSDLFIFGLSERHEVKIDHIASRKRDFGAAALTGFLEQFLDVLGSHGCDSATCPA